MRPAPLGRNDGVSYRDVSFAVPPGWIDSTAITLLAPDVSPATGSIPMIVMRRFAKMRGETFHTCVARALSEMGRLHLGLEITHHEDTKVDGRDAILIRFVVPHQGMPVDQAVVFVHPADDGARDVVTFACAAIRTHAAFTERALRDVLATVRFARAAPSEPFDR